MEFALALNIDQATRARDLLSAAEQNEPTWLGFPPVHACTNPDQRLWIEGNVLVYRGQRCPLAQDGALALIGEVLTGEDEPNKYSTPAEWKEWWKGCVLAFARAKVLRYETSDRRLMWWETLEGYIFSRATAEQALTWLQNKTRQWGPVTAQTEIPPILKQTMTHTGLSPAQRAASLTPEEMRLVRRLENLMA